MKLNLRQKPNSRERIIFFMALVAFGFVFYRIGIMAPNAVISKLETELKTLETEKVQLIQKSATQLQGNLQPKAQAHSNAMNWIGKKQNLDRATDSLIQAAHDNRVPVIKFNFPESKEKGNLSFRPINVSLSGSLAELGGYLERAEHLPIPLVVDRLSLEPSVDFAGIVTLRIEGGFYAEK